MARGGPGGGVRDAGGRQRRAARGALLLAALAGTGVPAAIAEGVGGGDGLAATTEGGDADALFTSAEAIRNEHMHGELGRGEWPAEAVAVLEKAADAGSAAAARELAHVHHYGLAGHSVDVERAHALYSAAAAEGDASAQAEIGFMYAAGTAPGGADVARAGIHLYFAASAGDVDAQMAMGFRHSVGWGAPKQCHAAVLYYQPVAERVVEMGRAPGAPRGADKVRLSAEAEQGGGGSSAQMVEYYVYTADLGNAGAQAAIGQLFNFGGHGIERDHTRALQYLSRASAQGDADAAAHLGHMHANGLGTPQDNATALKLFREAVEANDNAFALYGLGYMHLTGYGVQKDPAAAMKYFTRAAERGSADAQFHLGAMYVTGVGVPRKDHSKAFYHFSLAAHQSHTIAIYNLAIMHAAGLGAPMSCRTALSLMKAVAERGNVVAGELTAAHARYKAGDSAAGLTRYLKAAFMGFEVAQANVAWMIERGEGDAEVFGGNRTQALELALQMHWLSAELGNEASLLAVGDAHYYGRGVQKSARQAAAVYRAGTAARLPQAMFNLGIMHEYGVGMPRDPHLAKRFFDRARSQSTEANVPAWLALAKLAVEQWVEEKCGRGMCLGMLETLGLRGLWDRARTWMLSSDGFKPEDFFDGPDGVADMASNSAQSARAVASNLDAAGTGQAKAQAATNGAEDARSDSVASDNSVGSEDAPRVEAPPVKSPWDGADWEGLVITLLALALGIALMRRNALRARVEAAQRALHAAGGQGAQTL